MLENITNRNLSFLQELANKCNDIGLDEEFSSLLYIQVFLIVKYSSFSNT